MNGDQRLRVLQAIPTAVERELKRRLQTGAPVSWEQQQLYFKLLLARGDAMALRIKQLYEEHPPQPTIPGDPRVDVEPFLVAVAEEFGLGPRWVDEFVGDLVEHQFPIERVP